MQRGAKLIKRLSFELKEKMISLSGACFWYWRSFYSFLDSCGISKSFQEQYPRESYNKYEMMRAILGELEEKGQVEILNNIISNFYKLRNAVDKDNVDEKKAKQLLNEFRELVGLDPIENEIKKREQDKARKEYQSKLGEKESNKKILSDLNSSFIKLATTQELTPQQRGYKLEDLFYDLLHYSEFEHSKSYRTPEGEQIDGHFKYEKFDYLIEVKWTSELTKQQDLSVFDGKIRGKAQSTRGLFLSANGFDDNAVNKFSGDAPRIILMNGEDLAMILSGQVLFADAMKAKVDAIVRYGNINFPIRNIRT